jgi:hypothetical protein
MATLFSRLLQLHQTISQICINKENSKDSRNSWHDMPNLQNKDKKDILVEHSRTPLIFQNQCLRSRVKSNTISNRLNNITLRTLILHSPIQEAKTGSIRSLKCSRNYQLLRAIAVYLRRLKRPLSSTRSLRIQQTKTFCQI